MMELYTFELQLADKLTENDLWVKAFPFVRMSMEKAMEVMGDRMDTYDIYETHKDDDVEVNDICSGWAQRFSDESLLYLLPSINVMLKFFGKAIVSLYSCNAALEYEEELNEIKSTIEKMFSICKDNY